MLTKKDIEANFDGIEQLSKSILRFRVVTPHRTLYYYLKAAPPNTKVDDLIVVSQDRMDDKFATFILENIAAKESGQNKLELCKLSANKYGFTDLLLVPSSYHSYLGGVLDTQREKLTLCIPIYRCEFSGNETIEEFYALQKEVVPTLDWQRKKFPKIHLRFDNPDTQGGTIGDGIFTKYDHLLREIDQLEGVSRGFLEIKNYKGEVREILSPAKSSYVLIEDHDDKTRRKIHKDSLIKEIWTFLADEN